VNMEMTAITNKRGSLKQPELKYKKISWL